MSMNSLIIKEINQEENKEYLGEGNQFDNPVPRGLVALENLFDRKDKRKSSVEQMKPGEYIGMETEQKIIKIGKGTSEKERNNLINLVREYRDVFSSLMTSLKHIGKMFSSTPFP